MPKSRSRAGHAGVAHFQGIQDGRGGGVGHAQDAGARRGDHLLTPRVVGGAERGIAMDPAGDRVAMDAGLRGRLADRRADRQRRQSDLLGGVEHHRRGSLIAPGRRRPGGRIRPPSGSCSMPQKPLPDIRAVRLIYARRHFLQDRTHAAGECWNERQQPAGHRTGRYVLQVPPQVIRNDFRKARGDRVSDELCPVPSRANEAKRVRERLHSGALTDGGRRGDTGTGDAGRGIIWSPGC